MPLRLVGFSLTVNYDARNRELKTPKFHCPNLTQNGPQKHTFQYEILSEFFFFTNEYPSDCLKNNIKIYIKTAPTCFGAVTPSSGSALSMLAKVTLVTIANYCESLCD